MDRASKVAIEAYALSLASGENLSGQACPWCSEKTFSVKREATGILYNCYRNTCKDANRSAGFLGTAGVHLPTPARAKVKVGSPFLGDIRPLDNRERAEIEAAYGISDLSRYCEGCDMETGRYIMKVQGAQGQERGVVARVPPGDKRKPKSITYRNDFRHPYMAWYHGDHYLFPGHVDTLVLVEDQWSAIKLARTIPTLVTAALLGTSMSKDNAQEIGKAEFERIIICLDKDATRTAFQMRQENALYWNCNVLVLPLTLDIKDMASEDIRALFCGHV